MNEWKDRLKKFAKDNEELLINVGIGACVLVTAYLWHKDQMVGMETCCVKPETLEDGSILLEVFKVNNSSTLHRWYPDQFGSG